jgi:hypothetical protein
MNSLADRRQMTGDGGLATAALDSATTTAYDSTAYLNAPMHSDGREAPSTVEPAGLSFAVLVVIAKVC